MDYSKRWHIIVQIDEGGQGKTYKVIDHKECRSVESLRPHFKKFNSLLEAKNDEDFGLAYYAFRKMVWEMLDKESDPKEYVLKVINDTAKNRDYDKARARMENEIKALKTVGSTNLIFIIDSDPDFTWYVTDYYEKGTLAKNIDKFKGNVAYSLSAFIPLVETVAKIHKAGLIHRDIKPDNIFIDDHGNLILGDFGLAFSQDDIDTRLTSVYENVGSRDWMPPWSQGARLDKVKPTFDIFCLAKVFWSMISGRHFLRLWYFNESDYPEFNVEYLFQDSPSIGLINPLLKKCIVQHEKDCLPTIENFMRELNILRAAVYAGGEKLGWDYRRRCKVCGRGYYMPGANKNLNNLTEFGLSPKLPRTYRLLICEHCGHVQLFLAYDEGVDDFDAWKK